MLISRLSALAVVVCFSASFFAASRIDSVSTTEPSASVVLELTNARLASPSAVRSSVTVTLRPSALRVSTDLAICEPSAFLLVTDRVTEPLPFSTVVSVED
ncbi:hypothetical protein [Sinorhizobium medicae]|nr:hypothetical protein [Sinorhizobium medicae]